MADVPPKAKQEFERLVARLRKVPDRPDPRRPGFGEYSLFAGSKMFGNLDEDGGLVLRFPPERAEELLRSGTGSGWGVEVGSPLKGYVSIPLSRAKEWFDLSLESQAFKLEQDRKRSSKGSGSSGRK